MRTLKFNCYDEFACTGPKCEDTCCKNWDIFLTKKEYWDYKNMSFTPELKALMDKAFYRVKQGNSLQYATVQFKEDCTCHLLDKDGLCMLQKEKGEDALPSVCSLFPRVWGKIGDDAIVFSLTPTCCHAVELLMQHPEGLVLTEGEYDDSNKWINKGQWTGPTIPSNAKIMPYIWSIKAAQIDILQNRNFNIPERLLILGYFTQKACEYLENSPEKLHQLGAMMLDQELLAKLAKSLKASQTDKQAAAKSANIMFKLVKFARNTRPDSSVTRLLDIIAENTDLKFDLNDAEDEGESEDANNEYNIEINFKKLSHNFEIYSEIEADRPYIIENLLVNLIFSEFPADSKSLWENYFSLVLLYNFLQFYMSAFLPDDEYTDSELAAAITNTVKILLNSNLAKAAMLMEYELNGTNTLSYVAFLIN